MGSPRLNLKNAVALLADRDNFTSGLTAQILRGFGIEVILTANTGKDAMEILKVHRPDICFIEAAFPDMTGAELLYWIRRQKDDALRFVPAIILSGYTQLRMISAARDNGAHIVIRKPVSPKTLFDRILWVGNSNRAFLEADNYTGPDRRFHTVAPTDGVLKRSTDIPITEV